MKPSDGLEGTASFFEGTEKKVELLIDGGAPSLRGLGSDFWKHVVEAADAAILSKIGNEACDAYLLSESSLFVYDHKVLMITCGRTRLTGAIEAILQRIAPESLRLLTYERKNEVFPHRQPTSFFEDVAILGSRLPGRAFRLGHEDDHHLFLFHLDRPHDGGPDLTVEMLMYGIDESVRRAFAPGDGVRSEQVRVDSGIDALLDGFRCDDHLFQPCGYSLNGLRGDRYLTLHVTPDEAGSYVSLETNHDFDGDWNRALRKTVELFRPRSFDLIVWERGTSLDLTDCGYRLKDSVAQDLSCGYRIRFLNYYLESTTVRPACELPTPGLGAELETP